jgi:hypothetical protein
LCDGWVEDSRRQRSGDVAKIKLGGEMKEMEIELGGKWR